MRSQLLSMSPRWLLAALALSPALALAQVWMPPPMPVPPHVYIQQRIQWHLRRHLPPPIYYSPAPPPVWVAPAAPPPPVYVAPPPVTIEPQQQYYVQPQPIYQPPPAPVYLPPPRYYSPPPAVIAPLPPLAAPAPPLPQWNARLGLGATFEGAYGLGDNGTKGWGALGQLRYRTSRHTSIELMGGYEKSSYGDGVMRSDIPLTFGLLIPFLGPEHILSPYVVMAAGVNFADLHLVDTPDFKLDDNRVQGIGQIGGGLELRLGQHFSLNADARLEGRWNLEGPSQQVQTSTVKVDGAVVGPLQNSIGVRLGGGATVYF